MDGYGTGFTERENAGDEEGAPTAGASTVVCGPASSPWEAQRHRTEEAEDGSKQQSPFGSTPATRPYPTATSAQASGHFCPNPAERVKGEAPLTRDMGTSRQHQSHLCSIPAERASTELDVEEARLQRQYEALRQPDPHASPPRAGGNEFAHLSRFRPRWAWVNSRCDVFP